MVHGVSCQNERRAYPVKQLVDQWCQICLFIDGKTDLTPFRRWALGEKWKNTVEA